MAAPNYLGQAGQLAVMSEFLARGYNVAAPEVDVGDDLFVVHDARERFWKIQVKTATGVRRDYGWSAQFLIPLGQLQAVSQLAFYFVLVLRAGERWDYLIIPRVDLWREVRNFGVGAQSTEGVRLYLSFTDDSVRCSGRDLRRFHNNWGEWPNLLLS